ncbi:MAG: hypothetical protein R3C44_20160 [Chloroflexota bacterium]
MTNFTRRKTLTRLVLVNIVLLALVLIWNHQRHTSTVAVAVAKSKQMMDMPAAAMNLPAEYFLDSTAVQGIVNTSDQLASVFADGDFAYLSSIPLSEGEARYWQDEGCSSDSCALAIYYDYANGGALEAIIDLDTQNVVASWKNDNARPGGSSEVMPIAVEIAGADPQVQAVLGEIGDVDPAMIPMSGWLADDLCAEDFCVDLTFHDPAGTGRIVHVFVNLETEQVARIFYTWSRGSLSSQTSGPAQRLQ